MIPRTGSVLLALALIAAACGDDSSGTTSTIALTTTSAAATTVTTTTTTTTTAVTTTTAPATTTTAAPVLEFSPQGVGVATLGDDPEAVIEAVTAILGSPTHDDITASGDWLPHPFFPGAVLRAVSWGQSLQLYFGSQATPVGTEGTRHFQDWYYHGFTAMDGSVLPPDPPGLTTNLGIGVGDTAAAMLAIYTEAVLVQDSLLGRYRYQIHRADTPYYMCFHFTGTEAPGPTAPIVAISGSGTHDCTYGGE